MSGRARGYVIPGALEFSPDDTLITNLFSPEGTLTRKLFAFDPRTSQQRLLAGPPRGGGVDEAALSVQEKLQRERTRQGRADSACHVSIHSLDPRLLS